MSEISRETFHFFRSSQWKQVKLALRSHEGIDQVKTALIDFLVDWNGGDWIDWEKIEMVMQDLRRASLWRMLPYQQFLTEAEPKVSDEIMAGLRKLPY